MQGVYTCVGWQVTLCDPILQVTLCSCVIGYVPLTVIQYLYLLTESFRIKIVNGLESLSYLTTMQTGNIVVGAGLE